MNTTRQRHRITTAEVEVSNRHFTLTFKEEGMVVHEKHQPTKKDKLITMAELVSSTIAVSENSASPPLKAGAKAEPSYKPGSISETFDVAANDLCVLALMQHKKTHIDRAELEQAKETVLKALKVIRSLEIIAE